MKKITSERLGRHSGAALWPLRITLALILMLAFAPLVTGAGTLAPAGQGINPVTIPAGGTVSMVVRGFCTDFGKAFPTDNMTTNGLAADNIRAALNYSIQKGYTEANPAQVELAVWFLKDHTWHDTDNAVAQEIVNNAVGANAPPESGDGISLDDAVKQNKVTLQATFVPRTADHFYGDTALQITNTGASDLTVFMPVGTTFTLPNGGGKFQDLVAYALGSQGSPQAAPGTATSGPATTAAPTQTAAATAIIAAAPTDTAVAAIPTATLPATVAVATPTAMSTPVTPGLPETGSPGETGGSPGAAIALAALMSVILGLATRLDRSKRKATKRK